MFKSIKYAIFKLINTIVPKEERGVFAIPISNCQIDNYDLINYSSDTVLSFLNYWIAHPIQYEYKIYLIVFHLERLTCYKKYVKECNHLKFTFLPSHRCYNGIKKYLIKFKNLLYRFKCKYWIFEPVTQIGIYATKKQKQICLNYAISCKSDYVFPNEDSAILRKYSRKNNVLITTSSFFDSVCHSAAYGVPMECFKAYGLTRNDFLDKNYKEVVVNNWLKSIKKDPDTKVFLYAPTWRDYEKIEDVKARSIWGAGYNNDKIEAFLKENNILVIAKLHPWQNRSAIMDYSHNVIPYKADFSFSFYDLMIASDAMITDYSSIGLDYLLLNKPLIYNLYDMKEYREKRGFSYEPYEDLCGGAIVKNTEELLDAIASVLRGNNYSKKQMQIKNRVFERQSFDTCETIMRLFGG